MAAFALLLLFCAGAVLDRGSTANANSEADALIGYFNQYRTSHGIAPLYANPIMNSNSQDQARENALACQFGLTYSSGNHSKPAGMNSVTSWNTYGYNNATDVWAVYSQDPQMQSIVGDRYSNAVGIGLAYNASCQWGNIWVLDMAHFSGVPSVTPTHTPFATPAPTLALTPTPSTTPTISPAPTPTPTPTPSPSSTPTPPQSAAPSPSRFHGDANCDGQVNALDSLQILLDIGGPATGSTCAGADDVNCDGHVDATDAVVILRYVSGDASSTPPQCPALGSHV